MNESPIVRDDAPPPMLRAARLPNYLFVVLALYIVTSELLGDPFPFPVRQIAGGLMIAVLLLNNAWGWAVWFRSADARSSAAKRVLRTLAAAFLSYALFTIVYFNPLPGLAGIIVLFLTIPVGLAASAWGVSTCQDEVYRASVFESYTWGTLASLGLITVGIFVVRVSPAVSAWLQTGAQRVTNGLSPAAVGFGLGATFSIVIVSLCLSASWAIWWLGKR